MLKGTNIYDQRELEEKHDDPGIRWLFDSTSVRKKCLNPTIGCKEILFSPRALKSMNSIDTLRRIHPHLIAQQCFALSFILTYLGMRRRFIFRSNRRHKNVWTVCLRKKYLVYLLCYYYIRIFFFGRFYQIWIFLNRSIWPTDETITDKATFVHSKPHSNGNERVFYTLQNPWAEVSLSDVV